MTKAESVDFCDPVIDIGHLTAGQLGVLYNGSHEDVDDLIGILPHSIEQSELVAIAERLQGSLGSKADGSPLVHNKGTIGRTIYNLGHGAFRTEDIVTTQNSISYLLREGGIGNVVRAGRLGIRLQARDAYLSQLKRHPKPPLAVETSAPYFGEPVLDSPNDLQTS